MEPDKTYIVILRDSIANKIHILKTLIELTEEQEQIVKGNDPDLVDFDEILVEKDRQIEMLNMLDDGFNNVYERVREDVTSNPGAYRVELEQIQKLIGEAVELGAKLQAMEIANKEYIEAFIKRKKAEVKGYRVSKSTSASYYRNMANQHVDGASYFMDEKK